MLTMRRYVSGEKGTGSSLSSSPHPSGEVRRSFKHKCLQSDSRGGGGEEEEVLPGGRQGEFWEWRLLTSPEVEEQAGGGAGRGDIQAEENLEVG